MTQLHLLFLVGMIVGLYAWYTGKYIVDEKIGTNFGILVLTISIVGLIFSILQIDLSIVWMILYAVVGLWAWILGYKKFSFDEGEIISVFLGSSFFWLGLTSTIVIAIFIFENWDIPDWAIENIVSLAMIIVSFITSAMQLAYCKSKDKSSDLHKQL